MYVKKMSFETISEYIATWLLKNSEPDEIVYLKVRLGIESMMINISKGLIVYSIAILLQTLAPTFITHMSYLVVRKFSQGLHAKSSFVCTIVSIIMFVFLPCVVQNFLIDRPIVFLIGVIATYLFYKYAPADTEKSPILDAENRNRLRKTTVILSIFLTLFALGIIDPMIRTLVTLGLVLQVIMILPITYKILGRGYRNYEKYEAEVE